MGVIIYSFNLNISPKMSYGVLVCDTVMLQNYMLMMFIIKDFVIIKGHNLCQTLNIFPFLLFYRNGCHRHSSRRIQGDVT